MSKVIPFPDRRVGSRVLVCTGCGARIEVFELPTPFLDPTTFLCGNCMPEIAD